MRRFAAILSLNVRNSYRLNVVALGIMLGLAFFLISVFDLLICMLGIVPQLRSEAPDLSKITQFLALLAYGSGLIAMGMNLNVFTANSQVKEKAQRIHETLLGGPVRARELWMAKSLAVFLPGFLLCELCALAALLGADAALIAPRIGSMLTPLIVFNGLALVPIAYFPLCCLVLLVGLTGNPVSGNVIANIAFSAMIAAVIQFATRGALDVGSLGFTLVNFAGAALVGLILLLLQPRLCKERIVLSCRS